MRTAAEPGRSRLWWAWALPVVAVAVLLNQSAVHWRANVVDSLLFSYYGWCVSQGAIPYVDIWDNKPPGIWWVNSLGFTLFSEGRLAEIVPCAVALTASIYACCAAARGAFGRAITPFALAFAAAWLTALHYECGANRTETFVLACETGAMAAYLAWINSRRRAALAAASLLAGAAPLFKQSGIAVGLACALHLTLIAGWERGGRARAARSIDPPASGPPASPVAIGDALVAGCAGIILPALAAAWLALHGALSEAAFAVGRFNRAYFEIDDASFTHVGRALQTYHAELSLARELLVLSAAGVVAWLVILVRRSRATECPSAARPAPPHIAPLLLWLTLSLYLACVGPGRQGHHFMPVLAPLTLLALSPLAYLLGDGPLLPGLLRRPSRLAAGVASIALLAPILTDSRAAAIRFWNNKVSWAAMEYLEPPAWELQAGAIRRLSGADETIYVWGWDPGAYRCSYRRSASRFATIEKAGQVGKYATFLVEAAKQDIERLRPRLFLVSITDWEALRAGEDAFGRWLIANYSDAGPVEGMHVLRRVEHASGDATPP